MEKELIVNVVDKYDNGYGVYYLPKKKEFCCYAIGMKDFNKGNTFWGHYTHNLDMAMKDMLKRVHESYKVINGRSNLIVWYYYNKIAEQVDSCIDEKAHIMINSAINVDIFDAFELEKHIENNKQIYKYMSINKNKMKVLK